MVQDLKFGHHLLAVFVHQRVVRCLWETVNLLSSHTRILGGIFIERRGHQRSFFSS